MVNKCALRCNLTTCCMKQQGSEGCKTGRAIVQGTQRASGRVRGRKPWLDTGPGGKWVWSARVDWEFPAQRARCSFPVAAMTTCRKLGGFKQQKRILSQFGGQKSKIQVCAPSGSSGRVLPGSRRRCGWHSVLCLAGSCASAGLPVLPPAFFPVRLPV